MSSSTSLEFTLVTDDVERSITLYSVEKTLATTENVKDVGQNLLNVSGADTIKSVELIEQTNSPMNINFDS